MLRSFSLGSIWVVRASWRARYWLKPRIDHAWPCPCALTSHKVLTHGSAWLDIQGHTASREFSSEEKYVGLSLDLSRRDFVERSSFCGAR